MRRGVQLSEVALGAGFQPPAAGSTREEATRAAGQRRDWGRRLRHQVNQQPVRVFGSALLLEVISAGVQLSRIPDLGRGLRRAQR